jgi:hypothetical protein
MDANVAEIARELAALTQRFVDLGAKLGEAARALQDAGAPPSNVLVEALSGARGQFHQLRSQTLTVADAAGVPTPVPPESLHELEPILTSIAAALRARARRQALELVQQGAGALLDRVMEILHHDDPEFPALVGCRAKAREARAAVLALTELESDDARRVASGLPPFADLLAMVESRDGLDDERYGHLEESVTRAFGRPLAVAAARGKLGFEGEFGAPAAAEPPAPESQADIEPVTVATAAEPRRVDAEPAPVSPIAPGEAEPILEAPRLELETPQPAPELEAEPTMAVESAAAPAAEAEAAAEPSGPDETAQWWLAAWARWSGWKSSHDFATAVREELAKHPFLLSVPIQQSPEYEGGLLAYGYSILMDHVEKQNPGCIGNALNRLKPGQTRQVGEQLYDYLIAEGRLRETYAEFVKNTLVAALPEPGVWFQFRILESKDDTRILQRPSTRIGDTELSGQRLASDGQRYNEHNFKMTLGPLTSRFVVLSSDVKESRGAGFKLVGNGMPSDDGWVVSVSAGSRSGARVGARRIGEEGLHVPGLGKEHGSLWIAVFNPDPGADRRYELSVFLRKDTRSPFRTKA